MHSPSGCFGRNLNWHEKQFNSTIAYVFSGVVIPVVIVFASIAILIRKGFTFTGRFARKSKHRKK